MIMAVDGARDNIRYPRIMIPVETDLSELISSIKMTGSEGTIIPYSRSDDYRFSITDLNLSTFEVTYDDGTVVQKDSWEEFCNELVAGLSFLRPGQSASIRVVHLEEVVPEEYSGPVDEQTTTSDN